MLVSLHYFFFSSRRRHTRCYRDWSSDVCSSDLLQVDRARIATATEKHPERWLLRVESRGHGLVVEETLSREEQADELLLMGLRLTEGIDPARFAATAGRPLDASRIADLCAQHLLEIDDCGRLRVTPAGFPLLDAVVADLAA